MAYLRKEKETVEIDCSLNKVWAAIPKALKDLGWTTEQADNVEHHIKAKTQRSFMAWSSMVLIDATLAAENITRVTVAAETPVTTITSIVDFGRSRQHINSFLAALAKQLNS